MRRRPVFKCFHYLLLTASAFTFGDEGYSSAAPGVPARIFDREFTIYSSSEACAKAPEVARLEVRVLRPVMKVGERLDLISPYRPGDSGLFIDAYDAKGNFLPSVPVSGGARSEGRTQAHDPGIVYRDGSMDYWLAAKPGSFEYSASWLCAQDAASAVTGTATVRVLE